MRSIYLLTLSALLLVLGSATRYAHAQQTQQTPDARGPEAILEWLAPPAPDHSAAHWARFSEALVEALDAEQEALQLAALRLVIQYGPRVDVKPGVFAVARLYRDHPDDQVRRMAAVALGRMQSAWAIDYLARSARFEKHPQVLHTTKAVVAAHQAAAREAAGQSLQVAKAQ